MRADVTKKLFTVDDYYRMAEAGILKPEDRVDTLDRGDTLFATAFPEITFKVEDLLG